MIWICNLILSESLSLSGQFMIGFLKPRLISASFLCVGIAAVPVSSYAQDDRQRLIELVDQQNYQAAYRLADSLFDLLAGEPDFDYLYGLSAYHAGFYQEAIFAFERTLLVRPQDAPARYALALVYYKVNNLVAAEQEFTILKKQSDNALIKQNSQNYLAQIKHSQSKNKSSTLAKVSVGVGYDSNVGAGLSEIIFPLPLQKLGLVDFTLPKQSAYQQLLAAKILYRKPVIKSGAVLASGSVNKTLYSGLDHLETTQLDLSVGYAHSWQTLSARANLFYQKFWLGGSGYQDLTALLAKLSWQLDSKQKLALSTNFSATSNDDNSDLNLNTRSLKLSYSYRFDEHNLTAYAAHAIEEVDNFNSASKQFERDLNTFGLTLTSMIENWGQLRVQVQHQAADHPYLNETLLGQIPVLSRYPNKRSDHLNSIKFELDYPLADKWLWQNSIKIMNRSSNHAIYDFDRNLITSLISYQF